MISELTEVVSLPDGPRGFLLKPPQCLLCGSHVVSPPDGGRGLACPLQGAPVAGRALCCHRETAGLAECQTLGSSKPLCQSTTLKK